MINGLQRPGDVEVVSINLINNTGNVIDLYNQFQSVTIYESLFSNTMSGDIVIADALNLLENYTIIGQEKIVLKFKTPGKDILRVNEFNIYKISERVMVKERVQSYILHFTSEETILSLRQKISKSFAGKISDIVEKVYLNNFDSDNKTCYIEKTKYNHEYIIPYWEPIILINWLASSAVSEDDYNNYIFYETMNKFYFISLSKLYESKPIQDFIYSPANAPSKTIDEKMRSVKSFTIGSSFNTMRNIKVGMFAAKKRVINLINKEWRDTNYSYEADFIKDKHLLPNKFTSNSGDFLNRKYTDNYLSSYSFTAKDDLNNTIDGLERISSLFQLRNISIVLSIYGDSELECGNIINFHIPSAQPIYNEKVMDTYLSGKFIITSIRHDITRNSYDMYLEISKDGLENKLPDYAKYTE